jgi:hypothetical protein
MFQTPTKSQPATHSRMQATITIDFEPIDPGNPAGVFTDLPKMEDVIKTDTLQLFMRLFGQGVINCICHFQPGTAPQSFTNQPVTHSRMQATITIDFEPIDEGSPARVFTDLARMADDIEAEIFDVFTVYFGRGVSDCVCHFPPQNTYIAVPKSFTKRFFAPEMPL